MKITELLENSGFRPEHYKREIQAYLSGQIDFDEMPDELYHGLLSYFGADSTVGNDVDQDEWLSNQIESAWG